MANHLPTAPQALPHWIRPLGALLWCAFLVFCMACLSFGTTTIPVGGDASRGLRGLDTPFLQGVWGAEPADWDRSTPHTYRWTEPTWSFGFPFAPRGWGITRATIDTTGWQTPSDLIIEQPALGVLHLTPAVRTYSLLVHNDGASLTIRLHGSTLPSTTDRRALGVIVRTIGYTPLRGAWQPAAVIGLLAVLGLSGLACLRLVNALRSIVILSAGTVVTVVCLLFPDWWPLHVEAFFSSVLIAAAAGFVWAWLLVREPEHRASWGTGIAFAVFFPLIALHSPLLLSSDSAMHARMLFDVLRGNLFQLAELPCEAGAATVPYPPVAYLLAAPFALFTWDRDTAARILMDGAVVLHTGALVYFWRVMHPAAPFDRRAGLFLALAAMSLPFLQAVHIGELTNAWGHAVFIAAVASWNDPQRTHAQRAALLIAALLSHTGIALSISLVFAGWLVFTAVRTHQIPWSSVVTAVCAYVGAGLVYYSSYLGLVGQAQKYAACPPVIDVVPRLIPVATAIPPILLLLGIWGVSRLPRSPVQRIVLSGYGAALVSILVLIVKTQTVRWPMAVVPFLALAAVSGIHTVSHTWLRRILTILAIVSAVMSYGALWQRVLHYLH